MATTEKKKTDAEILFPDIEVAGETIRPFTFNQADKLLPRFEAVILTCKEKGITLDSLESKIFDIIKVIFPEIKPILSEILDKEEEEIGNFPIAKIVLIILTVVRQNSDLLKNLTGLSKTVISEIR